MIGDVGRNPQRAPAEEPCDCFLFLVYHLGRILFRRRDRVKEILGFLSEVNEPPFSFSVPLLQGLRRTSCRAPAARPGGSGPHRLPPPPPAPPPPPQAPPSRR